VQSLLAQARAGRYALGAFNVYNLDGALAVVRAAKAEHSPVLLQVHTAALAQTTAAPLGRHGAPGLPAALMQRAIALGVCKFNVNTELRKAYLAACRRSLAGAPAADLADMLPSAVAAMQAVAAAEPHLFGSSGLA
jgi:fructose/tagatose bisphosphate aldolase